MKILFDQGTPLPLKKNLKSHEIASAYDQGWGQIKNGELLERAIQNDFDALITTDQNLKHHLELKKYSISIIVLTTTKWPVIEKQVEKIQDSLDSISHDEYIEVNFSSE